MAEDHDRANDSVAETLKNFAEDLGVLIRSELESARAEMVEKAKSAGLGAGMLGAAAFGGLLTVISLTIFLMAVLALFLPVWLAVLIVTILWGGATAALALFGKRKIRQAGPPLPERTIENIKEDVRSAQEEVRAARR